ncbi:MAG TPA: hypothetical protein VL992_15525 [Tepidisphaeraceae bacterium]|nr:hypothetical protein [Tepidisphaeraceae bacterium]
MNTPTTQPVERAAPGLTVQSAIRLAWLAYAVLLVVPFFVALWFIWQLDDTRAGASLAHGNAWFLASMIVVAAAVAAASLWRDHIFHDYSKGHTVPPKKYLAGMIEIWSALAFAGVFSLVGCIATQSLLPNLIPAFMGLVVYVLLLPTGRVMVHPVGGSEDPEVYEEPR